MIPQKVLAEKWGISPAAISKMVKAGMPLTSESEAETWKIINTKKPSRAPNILRNDPHVEDPKSPDIVAALSGEDAQARLNRARAAEKSAFYLVGKASQSKKDSEGKELKDNNGNAIIDLNMLRVALAGWREAKACVDEAEVAYEKHLERSRQVIRVNEVREMWVKYLGGIYALMKNMPASTAARANPSDPECAKIAIQESVDRIFTSIKKAEGVFS
jgi:hypothetical protein